MAWERDVPAETKTEGQVKVISPTWDWCKSVKWSKEWALQGLWKTMVRTGLQK